METHTTPIKQYQVWYLNVGDKVIPYMVLSNDRMNGASPVIVAAHVFQGKADSRQWYQIPFIGTCGKPYYVDICDVHSFASTAFEEKNYSGALSYYTVPNKELHGFLDDAVSKLFGIKMKVVSYFPVDDVVNNPKPVEEAPVQNQPIQLTINLNGIPFNVSAQSETVTTVSDPVVADTTTEPETVDTGALIIEKETESSAPAKMCKAAVKVNGDEITVTKEPIESVEDQVQAMEQSNKKNTKGHLTDTAKQNLDDYIINNSKIFGGDMTATQIADEFGLAVCTVARHTNAVKKLLEKIFYRGGQKTVIPAELIPRFLKDYARDMEACMKKYKKYGISNKSQLYGFAFRYKKALKENAIMFSK